VGFSGVFRADLSGMKNLFSVLMITGGVLTIEHSAFAQFWAVRNAPVASWKSIASSADGTKLVAVEAHGTAGTIYTSTDSGLNWTQATNAPSGDWTSVASSADGTKLVAAYSGPVAGRICISEDSGATWMQVTNLDPNLYWFSVASSADGMKLVAAAGYLYLSTNSGVDWTTNTDVPPQSWHSVASSADGSVLAAASFSINGLIWISTDAGATWTSATNAPPQQWVSVALSADGTRLVAAGNSTVYISNDTGATWMQATNGLLGGSSWMSVASSADGTILAVSGIVEGGSANVLISTNSGTNWTPTLYPPTDQFRSICCSADGTRMAGVMPFAYDIGGIYTLQAGPGLNIALSGTNILVSWPSYATGYVLQENPDLTTMNWTDISPTSTVTNGQTQVTISPTNSQSFYRLRSP
jgi:photosystem II stability/assembly factor-like uncharacterized protein